MSLESEYWEDVLNEASDKNDYEMMQIAMRHLELLYPNTEDTALLGTEEDEENDPK